MPRWDHLIFYQPLWRVGDVNGDGIADIIIGAGNANSGLGYTFVVFGKQSGWAASTTLTIGAGNLIDGTQGVRFDGVTFIGVFGLAGYTVAAGDVNGDGYADIIIGTPWGRPPPTFPTVGIVYVVFGKSGTWGAAGNQLLNVGSGNLIDGSQGVRFNGTVVNTQVGTSVATGDVNGDGYADIVMGGYAANLSAGYTFVVFGKSTASTPLLASTTVTTTASSASATVASYKGLQVGQYVNSAHIPTTTYISACGGGTVCTSTTLTLSTGTGVTAGVGVAMTVASTPLNIGAGTFIDGT